MSEQELPAVELLKKAVIDQKKMFLPIDPPAPAFKEIHQAVTAYDRAVSQMVIGAIQGRQDGEPPEAELSAARRRIDVAFENEQLDNNRKIDLYRGYVMRLDRMLDLVRQVMAST